MRIKAGWHLILAVALAVSSFAGSVACQPAAPVIVDFSCSPAEISAGESATLSWIVRGATKVNIDKGVGMVDAVGTKEVSPSKTTTYRLVAINSGVVVNSSVVVTVGVASPPSPETTAPVISEAAVSGITDSAATITWATDEPATSQVEYGTTSSYDSTTTLDEALVTSHSVSLTGLEGDTAYHFRVKSQDEAGNEAVSTDETFTTSSEADTTPPVISSVVASNITESGANIAWTTNEPATSQVEYGVPTDYGSASALEKALVTSHSAALAGLESGATYHFRVKSQDEAGNEAASGDYTFLTSEAATEVGGIISTNTVWTEANSPYVITETAQIASGVTLTIEPGTNISKPTSGNMFLLMGTIYAHGTSQKPIVIDGGGNSKIVYTQPGYGYGDFQYCVIKNGHDFWDRWGHLDLRYSELINLSVGSHTDWAGRIIGLDGPSGESNIEYNRFINTGGIYSYNDRYGTNIRYNLFQGLRSPLAHMGGGTPSNPPRKMTVKFNSFIDMEGLALYLEPGFIGWSPNIDATENYWETLETDIIDQKIYDRNDDISVENYIDYLPILSEPHPNTPRS